MDDKISQVHRNNVQRYYRLLKTHLTDVERQYIECRLSEEQAALRAIAGPQSSTTMLQVTRPLG